MTHPQQQYVQEAQKSLQEARKHLDAACFSCGDISDEDYAALRSAYTLICEAIDKL